MADAAPSKAEFQLPKNPETLAKMRDQLSDYLGTLERNTDAINAWLQKNQAELITGHHQLVRAIKYQKDETAALKILNGFGDAAGFVAAMQDFTKLADENFGANSTFAQEIKRLQLGVPAKILEELPEMKLPGPEDDQPVIVAAPPPPPPAPEPEKKKWWQPSGWFGGKKDEGPKGPSQAEIDAENQRREDELRRHWRLVRGELIALQSDRHYYVDSFMEWVGETLAPEDGKPKDDNALAKLMEKYQNPQTVIDLARKDYSDVVDVKAQALRDRAVTYSQTASLLDEQRIDAFTNYLPTLFPKVETNETKQMKEFLLKDFGAASFAELALNHVKDRRKQLDLLEMALKHESEFKLSGATTKRDVFQRILRETTAAKDPLDPRALDITLKKLRSQPGKEDLADLIDLKSKTPSVFEQLAGRFKDGADKMREAIDRVLEGMNGHPSQTSVNLANVVKAARDKDALAMGIALTAIQANNNAQAFMALWHLTYPTKSLLDEISSTAKTPAELAKLTDTALSAGLLNELRAHSNAATGNAQNFFAFFNKNVMATPGDFPLQSARKLIAHTFANGGLAELRLEITKSNGWLEKINKSSLPEDAKLNWTAALLEPWESTIVKSNILAEASTKALDAGAKAALDNIEKNYAGPFVRLSPDKLMTNLHRISNIWYNAETRALRYTVSGTGHTLMDDVSPEMAKETLAHIKRKGGFMDEYDGLFHPEKLDAVLTTPHKSKVAWEGRTGDLNVSEETFKELHKRDDFLHAADSRGNTLSINLRAVTLLQPLSDGTHLLVDKYGEVRVVEGLKPVKAWPGLLDLGGTLFNPKNASITSLNHDKAQLEFRCESNDFDELLKNVAPGQYFYTVELASKADVKRIEDEIKKDPATQAADKGSLRNMHFNMGMLGYLTYIQGRETGFNCRKNSPARKNGFISAEEDLSDSIFKGMSANPDLICVANIITHKSCIDDAYYNADKGEFFFVIGDTILRVDADEKEAYAVLKKLSREDGFTVVGANMVGRTEVPADVVNLGHATSLQYSEVQERTNIIAAHEKFHISLDRAQSRELLELLEQDALKDTRAATASAAWTQNLKDTLGNMPEVQVKVPQAITDLSRPYLLDQLTGKPGENRDMPKPQRDFAIAARPLSAGDTLAYPPRGEKPQAKPAQKRRV
ncbi:MAG: hypothetical protein ACAH80_07730 [Alphaproteobacteria bacterium]